MSLLRQRSPSELLDQYKPGLSFFIFLRSSRFDAVGRRAEKFIEGLPAREHPVPTFSAPGEHDFSFRNFDYLEVMKNLSSIARAMESLGKDLTEDQSAVEEKELLIFGSAGFS